MGDTGADPMESARYMAEISNRMQVPDRIMVSGDEQGGAATAPSPSRAAGEGKYNDLGMRQRDPRIDMQVRTRGNTGDAMEQWRETIKVFHSRTLYDDWKLVNIHNSVSTGTRQDHGGRR